ncbi:MAG: hypothetical protein PHQ58_21975 [Rhodoferax sp.]|uniref:hypothetical protein n=1 Tax=Rhodoferax sp. TaxID=50421 RepID=UPI002605BD46|nr:hypothetical protein [Rhodoferax sp.]MDD2883090.1 hypothetical protein [Rhodoferax sp.]
MSAICRRLNNLQAARAKLEQRKGTRTYSDDVRELLQSIDGQDEGAIPGEGLHNELVRRTQAVEGWNLAALPGDTNDKRWANADLIAQGKLPVSDESRHAARHWIELWEGI